jgi:superoxide reductase
LKRRFSMNRREFLKVILVTTAVLSPGKSFAGNYEKVKGEEFLKIQNRENPTALEQKHVPAIEAPDVVNSSRWFNVKIKVGFMNEHPSNRGHWINMIKLLADGRTVAQTEYKVGGITASEATFRIQLLKSSTLKAVETCNLHGTWISDPVKVMVT